MALVRLYLMTEKTIVQLGRKVPFNRIPCVGERFKFQKTSLHPHMITEVTHDEAGDAEVVIGPQLDPAGKYYCYNTDVDLRAQIAELLENGWDVLSKKKNTAYQKND